jgi:hypothetical protein
MRVARIGVVLVVGIVAGLLVSGCRSCVDSAPAPTVAGPETPAVLAPLDGHLLFTVTGGALMDVELPAKAEKMIRLGEKQPVHAVAGPDGSGRIVIVVDEAPGHALKVLPLSGGPEKVVFARPGGTLWDHATGASIALAREGGNVALLEKTAGYQIAPEAYVEPGCLEVWNLDRGTGGPLGTDACLSVADRGLSFSTDGGTLAYVAYDPRETTATLPNSTGESVTAWATWKKLPVVHLYEFANKRDTAFAVGERPVLAEDGASVLLQDSHGSPVRIDRASKVVTHLGLPGETGFGVVAAVGDAILYQGFATAGAPRKTRPMSMGGTEDLHTVKVTRAGTNQFATIAEGVGIWSSVSFGRLKR